MRYNTHTEKSIRPPPPKKNDCLLNFQSEYACVTRTGNQNLTNTPGALYLPAHSLCAPIILTSDISGVFARIEHQIDGMIQDGRLCVWLLLPNIVFLRLSQALVILLALCSSTVFSCPTVCFSIQLLADIGTASHSGLS